VQAFRTEKDSSAPVTVLHMERNSIKKILKKERGWVEKTKQMERNSINYHCLKRVTHTRWVSGTFLSI
jgi:hypothetical protein